MKLYKVICSANLKFIIEAESEENAIQDAKERISEDSKLYKEFLFEVQNGENENV